MPRLKNIVVWFSCGAASAVAAKKTLEKYRSTHNVTIVNNPIINEHPDNVRFLKDCEKWLGVPIVLAKNPDYESCDIREVFDKRKYMGGSDGAPCTMLLKKGSRYHYEKSNKVDYHVLGFTLEEKIRSDRFIKYERGNVIPILIDLGISKSDCFSIILDAGIKLPEIYELGFPNANCIGCVKSASPTYWNLVREKFPDVFEERSEQSYRLGAKLVKLDYRKIPNYAGPIPTGQDKRVRLFLKDLPPDAKAGKIKSWDCGIFCNVK